MIKDILADIKINGNDYICFFGENMKPKITNAYSEECDLDSTTINIVLSKILISKNLKNHIKLNVINHNAKRFQVMYDKTSGFKFFYELKDEKLISPSLTDFITLFQEFNYQELFKNNDDFLWKLNKFRRILN